MTYAAACALPESVQSTPWARKENIMKNQPKTGYKSNDNVQTPPILAERLVHHFRPSGRILEPCRGDGHVYDALTDYVKTIQFSVVDWCEIQQGRDFYDYFNKADWIITNPPWSQLRDPMGDDTHPISFMRQCFMTAKDVVLLLTLNHAIGMKARFGWMDYYNMHIREIVLFDTPPKPWPQAGFQNAAVHWQKGYSGLSWRHTDWRGGIGYE